MAKKKALKVVPESGYRSSLWSVRIPSATSPLQTDSGLRIPDERAHAFFLLCCELYRVLELNQRKLNSLIEIYSRFRTREHFRESLTFRFFDQPLQNVAAFDPDLAAQVLTIFNVLHELRVSISYSDALPHTVRTEIEGVLAVLAIEWNNVTAALRERHGWDFKSL